MAWHVGDMAYKICLECSVSSLLNVVLKHHVLQRILVHLIYTTLCASALSERLLGKDDVMKGFLTVFSPGGGA